MHKDAIRQRFNRAAASYDKHAHIQNSIAEKAIHLLKTNRSTFHSVVDIGCGSGESIKALQPHIHFNYCIGVDISEKLLGIASQKLRMHNNIQFLHANFEKHVFRRSTFDLVFSNLSLHWTPHHAYVLTQWCHFLRADGFFLLTIPAEENFPEIQQNKKIKPPSALTIISTIQNSGLTLVDQTQHHIETHHASQLDVLKSLKKTGVNSHFHSPSSHKAAGLSRLKLEDIFTKPSHNQLTYIIDIYVAKRIKR